MIKDLWESAKHDHFRQRQNSRAFQLRSHIGWGHTTCTPVIEEIMLWEFDRNPQTSLSKQTSLGYTLFQHYVYTGWGHKHFCHFQEYRHCVLTIIPNALHLHSVIYNNRLHSQIFHNGFCLPMNPLLHWTVSWTKFHLWVHKTSGVHMPKYVNYVSS